MHEELGEILAKCDGLKNSYDRGGWVKIYVLMVKFVKSLKSQVDSRLLHHSFDEDMFLNTI